MREHGFLRVVAAVPQLHLANPQRNAAEIEAILTELDAENADLVIFPEMGLTGYTCSDLYFQRKLQSESIDALIRLKEFSKTGFGGLFCVGLPIVVDDQIFNAAAIISSGEILGVIPKSYLPTYKEFYDARFFAPASTARSEHIYIDGEFVPFGTDLLFQCVNFPEFILGVEICEDLWVPVPPSSLQALHGATVLANLSASNETIGKAQYRRDLVNAQSARCLAAYVYTSSSIGESSTDIVFSGHGLISENGKLLGETERFQTKNTWISRDVDLHKLAYERTLTTTFSDGVSYQGLRRNYQLIPFELDTPETSETSFRGYVNAHPFVPSNPLELAHRCEEIFQIQSHGLGRRLSVVGQPPLSIGVSGGLDSTLALLILVRTLDQLEMPRSRINAITMPGFGTTSRTLGNSEKLMESLQIHYRRIDIRPMCIEEMKALGHSPFGITLEGKSLESLTEELRKIPDDKRHDLIFENVQARIRTSLLMNSGFVIGTGDLSELALGWCTYNADHMSMYNPNVSIPKTLVKFLVRWLAENQFDAATRSILLDIVATEISPELLPANEDGIAQSTEGTVGPYELHDFFLYHFLRYGATPEKILYLATLANFHVEYDAETLEKWLKEFIRRFFANQFKRSCLPDGPKVGSVSLSPRGDWRMPSDAQSSAWLRWADPKLL
jgi:NAD+ synthase (glutamine-hydrolysing)